MQGISGPIVQKKAIKLNPKSLSDKPLVPTKRQVHSYSRVRLSSKRACKPLTEEDRHTTLDTVSR